MLVSKHLFIRHFNSKLLHTLYHHSHTWQHNIIITDNVYMYFHYEHMYTPERGSARCRMSSATRLSLISSRVTIRARHEALGFRFIQYFISACLCCRRRENCLFISACLELGTHRQPASPNLPHNLPTLSTISTAFSALLVVKATPTWTCNNKQISLTQYMTL